MSNVIDFNGRVELRRWVDFVGKSCTENGFDLLPASINRIAYYLNEISSFNNLMFELADGKSTDFAKYLSEVDGLVATIEQDSILERDIMAKELVREFIEELTPIINNFRGYVDTGDLKYLESARKAISEVGAVSRSSTQAI